MQSAKEEFEGAYLVPTAKASVHVIAFYPQTREDMRERLHGGWERAKLDARNVAQSGKAIVKWKEKLLHYQWSDTLNWLDGDFRFRSASIHRHATGRG